ncbi:hypothetical protein MMC26_001612 [Xylographa opegraphella]|nr:hypothetical protein [Xylographa opegraphella]
MEAQVATFRKLKPACVAVNQVVLKYKARNTTAKEVNAALESLYQVLQSSYALDAKLADYVFFPLSFVFRDTKSIPARAVELSLNCLKVLITRGWRQELNVEVCKQLLILFGILSGGDDVNGRGQDADEGMTLAALECINSLCLSAKDAVSKLAVSSEAESTPVIGHVVGIVLASLTGSSSVDVQIMAIEALNALEDCLSDQRVLRSFLPGVVSSLTKVLKPSTKTRPPYKVLAGALRGMTTVLEKTLSGRLSSGTRSKGRNEGDAKDREETEEESWIAATSGQIKLALANIVGLRHHERPEVRDALFSLCTMVLENCKKSLQNCTELLLETVVCICVEESNNSSTKQYEPAVARLILSEAFLSDTLMTLTYDWISALPRVLQSANDIKRARHVGQIITAYRILARTDKELKMLESSLASNLQECTIAIMRQPPRPTIQAVENSQLFDVSQALEAPSTSMALYQFNSIAMTGSGPRGSLTDVLSLVDGFELTVATTAMKKRLADTLTESADNEALPYLWLSSKLLQNSLKDMTEMDDYINLSANVDETTRNFMEVVYSYSINLLSAPAIDDDSDWRLQAVALEIFAWQSCHDKHSFRAELVDVLYPILERIGSNNTLLREHAMTCLNIVYRSCGYASASDLIIQNADYLVNSVALKFNTFEISPQAPQVLTMMLKLCGPRLVPYLDDVVESVFSALSRFHGYTRLAESLFGFLRTVVEVGSSASSSRAIEQPAVDHRKISRPQPTIAEVVTLVQARRSRIEASKSAPIAPGPAPHIPWTDVPSPTEDDEPPEPEPTLPPAALDKTYLMTQSILRLGQHYLTSPSPTLRLWLLQLTSTGCASLAHNEDAFLPLINDIWPVVTQRLHDPEPYIRIAATETLSTIFRTAGDFVASRVDTEWPDLRALCTRTRAQVAAAKSGKAGRGAFAAPAQLWDALVAMLVQMVDHVSVQPGVEDELMELLGPLVRGRADVRDALERLNPDAVWLLLLREDVRSGKALDLEPPQVEGFTFTKVVL